MAYDDFREEVKRLGYDETYFDDEVRKDINRLGLPEDILDEMLRPPIKRETTRGPRQSDKIKKSRRKSTRSARRKNR